MRKANPTGCPGSFFNIVITPEELRTVANRMEAETENTLPGQEIRYELTKDIVLTWEPEPASQKTSRQLIGIDRPQLSV